MRLSLFAVFAVAACQPAAVVLAPEGLSYHGAPFALQVGVALPEQRPSLEGGGAIMAFSISKPLPEGLSFDTSNGFISGTPAVTAANAPYVVVASNEGGTASVTLELRVDANGEAPTGLQYPMSDVSYVKGTAIAALTPSVQGTQPMTFTIEPALPAGLSLLPSTGTLSGTPTVALARTAFTVTARNMPGAATVTLHLAVTEQLVAPALTGYSAPRAVYAVGSEIAPNVPRVSGTPPFGFAVDKALPAGLSLGADGRITGTPSAVTAASDCVITATNPAGSSSFTLTLRVVATAMFSYPAAPFQFVSPGTAIPAIAPTLLPSGVDPLAIDPALPSGLTFDAATGQVRGAPSRASAMPLTTFVVTATDSTTREMMSATFRLELLEPLSPGQAAGVRQGNVVGPNGPTGAAGVVTNGILIDVTDSFDGAACKAPAGSSLSPSSGSIAVGESIAFRLASTPFHSWINSIAQQNAPAGDVWPSAPCLLLGNLGSTCVIGVNHGGVTYEYANLHSGFSCPDPGTVTVAP